MVRQGVVLLLGTCGGISARGQEPISPPPRDAALGHVVCPPKFSVPIFVPAEQLLREAEQQQPRTPEGWIVRNRPVPNCVNCWSDPATRLAENVEIPLRMRQSDSQVRLLEAELASWRRRLKTYEYFNKAGGIPVTVEHARLAISGLEEQLRLLREERRLWLRWRTMEKELASGVPVSPVITTSATGPAVPASR